MSLSLVYFIGTKEHTLNLVASSQKSFDRWYSALQILLGGVKVSVQLTSLRARYLKYVFEAADTDSSGTLTRDEVTGVLQAMNADIPLQQLDAFFNRMDADKSGELDVREFQHFVECVSVRKDIIPIWNIVASGLFSDAKEILDIDADAEIPTGTIAFAQLATFWERCMGASILSEIEALPEERFTNVGVTFDDFALIMVGIAHHSCEPSLYNVI
jgi:hypothetical protein